MNDAAILAHISKLPHSRASFKQLVRELGTKGAKREELEKALSRMAERGDLIELRGGEYTVTSRSKEFVTGRLNLHREPLSVSAVMGSASERFRAANPERKLDLSLDADAFIEGDSERLAQVMDNLLSNAAKYSSPEGTITSKSRMDGAWVRIAVIDRGRGIAPEHLPRFFDRFYRVPTDDAAGPPGSGLGLSIVRDLVEAHGGRVEAASKGLGKGSTFTVILPVSLALQSEPEHVAGTTGACRVDTFGVSGCSPELTPL